MNSKNTLICTVCGNEFEITDDTKYIIAGGYTCSWKCFLNEMHKRNKEKNDKNRKGNVSRRKSGF